MSISHASPLHRVVPLPGQQVHDIVLGSADLHTVSYPPLGTPLSGRVRCTCGWESVPGLEFCLALRLGNEHVEVAAQRVS